MNQKILSACGLLLAMLAGEAMALVPADEAKQLGTTLTLWGAEKTGNKEKSIPEYTGTVKAPSRYDPKTPGVRPDPYSSEKPLYSVTTQNMDKYAGVLSEGVKEMLKKYPTFRLDVYPSHRTANFPKLVLDNTLKNATQCKAENDELQLEGCYGGIPFPLPKTGKQAMWNHLVRYNTHSFGGSYRSYLVDASGNRIVTIETENWQEFPFFDPQRTGPIASSEIYWKYRGQTSGPARKAGEKWLLLASADGVNVGQRVWQYLRGQRRVKLSPDVAYDTPNPQMGGAATMDETMLFNGTMDRYDFKLEGKRELLIPYNNFKLTDAKQCPDATVLTPNHFNPDCVRWELHRVWVVNLTIKPGQRHIYPKRTVYLDEDWTGAGVSENYDAAGKIYRVGAVAFFPMYETQAQLSTINFTLDLGTGAWVYNGNATETGGYHLIPPQPSRFYTAESMTSESR